METGGRDYSDLPASRGPKNGDHHILLTSASLFRRPALHFCSAVNNRNSREILELAAAFAQDQEDLSDDAFGVVPVDPTKALRSTGVMPTLLPGETRRHECERALSAIASLIRADGCGPTVPGRLTPGQIGILYPHLSRRDRPALDEFVAGLRKLAPVVWLRDSDRDRVAEPGVKVQTIHGSKGLQYRAVVVLWADLLPRTFADSDPGEDARLMYVALTRPENFLFITHSGPSTFINRIRQSGKAVMR